MGASNIANWRNSAPASNAPDAPVLESLLDHVKRHVPIAVVHGGDRNAPEAVIRATHNPRSDKTYAAVAADIANSLGRLGFQNVELVPEQMQMGERLRQLKTGLVWVNSGGTQGFSSICHAPSMLEMMGIPYIGHNPLNAALLDNKHAFKHILVGLSIATPDFFVCDFKSDQRIEAMEKTFDRIFRDSEYQVIKPVSGRASIHVHRVQGKAEAFDVARNVYEETGNLVLIEKFIPGTEYTIAINGPMVCVGRKISKLKSNFIFSATRRIMGEEEPIFTSMDLRPIGPDRCRLLDTDTEASVIAQLSALAKQIYDGFDLEAMVRIDARADRDGQIYVLEANPKPDLKQPTENSFSFVAAGLGNFGMDYDDLINTLMVDRLRFLLSHRSAMVASMCDSGQ